MRKQVIEDIHYLDNRSGSRRAKYRRNMRAYLHTFGYGMTNIDDTSVVGYYNSSQFEVESDTTSGIQENIIKSCVDTLVSKIASQKVRPFFNTINGTFRDMQIVKQAQQFFDVLFDEQQLNKTITSVFRDAAVFEMGAVYIDKDDIEISRVMPWQLCFDQKEASYGNLTRILWKQENFPRSLLPEEIQNKIPNKDPGFNVTLERYWNVYTHTEAWYIPELNYYIEKIWEPNALPFLFMFYDDPIKSNSSVSIVDVLYGLQEAIDEIVVKIKDASQLAAPLKYLVPNNSNIKVDKISDRSGQIISYTPIPNQTTPPIVVATEPFMDPQWIATLDKFKQDAYELCGISQLSATSQKPSGLNSGVALSTMEDIESDRFEVQLNSVIRMYVDVAKLCMALFDPNKDILPANRLRMSISWGDIVQSKDMLSIQFSAAESLSKDPQTRAQQVAMLVQMGAIPQSRVAMLMEIPDVVQGYSLANNAINAVLAVIDECIEKGVYDIPDFIPLQMLMSEILNTCLSLKASNNPNNVGDIQKLIDLYTQCTQKQMDSQTSAEMMAVGSLGAEMTQDLSNPNGQINTAVNQATQMGLTESGM